MAIEPQEYDDNSAGADFSGVQGGDSLPGDKLLFVDLQLRYFRIQRRPRNSEFRCRTIWASNFPLAFSQRGFDYFSLLILESVWQRD
jgi:hypothetical protein